MLTLLVWGAANVNAQVRIGGTDNPATGVVLDLNATDSKMDGMASLVLPRVELTSIADSITVGKHKAGKMVYNTTDSAALKPGVYHNDGKKWNAMVGYDDAAGCFLKIPSGVVVGCDSVGYADMIIPHAGSISKSSLALLYDHNRWRLRSDANLGVRGGDTVEFVFTSEELDLMALTTLAELKLYNSGFPTTPQKRAYCLMKK